VEATSYQTVEALATFIARIVTMDFGNQAVTVLVEKPSAMAFVERAGVEVSRSRAFFAQQDYMRRREGLEPYS
jgi:dihydroneopterin aldolase